MTSVTSRAAVATRRPAYTTRAAYTVWRYVRVLVPAVVLWYLLSVAVGNAAILPSPASVAEALVELAREGLLAESTGASLSRLATGYGAAVLVCVPLGIAMGLSSVMRGLLDPVVEILRPISGIAWIPLAIMLFGIGDSVVVFIIFYGAAFPVILNTIAGVRHVDPHLVDAARSFGVRRHTVITQVVLPSALPMILVGLRIAAGTAWMSLVAAELVGSDAGLGFSLEYYRQLLMAPYMIGYIVVIGLLGLLTNVLLLRIQRTVTPWAASEGDGR